MEFTLTKTDRLVINAAARDNTRPVLHCVHISTGRIEAANGYVLVQRKLAYKGDTEVLLDIEQIAKHKDSRTLREVTYVKQEKNSEIKVLGEDTYIVQAQTGDYPKTDLLYPKGAPVFQIALPRSHLLELLKCLSKDEQCIKFSFYGKEKPVKFVVGNNTVKGLLMPMFAGENEVW